MKIINIANEGVIYMGVKYSKSQWEVKLKELRDKKIKKLTE